MFLRLAHAQLWPCGCVGPTAARVRQDTIPSITTATNQLTRSKPKKQRCSRVGTATMPAHSVAGRASRKGIGEGLRAAPALLEYVINFPIAGRHIVQTLRAAATASLFEYQLVAAEMAHSTGFRKNKVKIRLSHSTPLRLGAPAITVALKSSSIRVLSPGEYPFKSDRRLQNSSENRPPASSLDSRHELGPMVEFATRRHRHPLQTTIRSA